jgi:hypothetical protein
LDPKLRVKGTEKLRDVRHVQSRSSQLRSIYSECRISLIFVIEGEARTLMALVEICFCREERLVPRGARGHGVSTALIRDGVILLVLRIEQGTVHRRLRAGAVVEWPSIKVGNEWPESPQFIIRVKSPRIEKSMRDWIYPLLPHLSKYGRGNHLRGTGRLL